MFISMESRTCILFFPCETIYQNIRNNYSKINSCSKFGPSLVICNYVKMY